MHADGEQESTQSSGATGCQVGAYLLRPTAPGPAHIFPQLVSGDAHHITQPPPDGRGAVLAMQRAIRQAGLQPEDIEYVNAHATSTPVGTPPHHRKGPLG